MGIVKLALACTRCSLCFSFSYLFWPFMRCTDSHDLLLRHRKIGKTESNKLKEVRMSKCQDFSRMKYIDTSGIRKNEHAF